MPASSTLALTGWRLRVLNEALTPYIITVHHFPAFRRPLLEGRQLLVVSVYTLTVFRVEAVYLLPLMLSVYLAKILIFANKASNLPMLNSSQSAILMR